MNGPFIYQDVCSWNLSSRQKVLNHSYSANKHDVQLRIFFCYLSKHRTFNLNYCNWANISEYFDQTIFKNTQPKLLSNFKSTP
jgi:hypothetical protein